MIQAPQGSYLIAGLPRSRTAWLTALLYQDDLPCYHDAYFQLSGLVERGTPFGFASPSLVCVNPQLALQVFAAHPIVTISRDPTTCRQSLARWSGLPSPHWTTLMGGYDVFCRGIAKNRDVLHVSYESLDTYETANALYRHVLNRDLPEERFQVFDGLQIEQNRAKASRGTQWPG